MTHSYFQNKVCLAIQKAFPHARIENRTNGVFRGLKGNEIVTVGVKGRYDVFIMLGALHLELEIKVKKDRLRPEQLKWQETCERLGIPNFVCHCKSKEEEAEKIQEVLDFINHTVKSNP